MQSSLSRKPGDDQVPAVGSNPNFGGLPVGGIIRGGPLVGLVCGALCTALGAAHAAETAKVPNFAPDSQTGWQLMDDDFIPPPRGPGPGVSDPAHPYISFYRFPRNPKPSFRVPDLTNPILLQWTRERLRNVNERSLSGQIVSIPKERCWPVGVPAFLLLPATPVYFLQTAKEVTMIWMQDTQVGRVYLDPAHSQ